MVKRVAAAVCLILATSCGGSSDSPTSPTPTPTTQNRIIGIVGDLSFGEVLVGQSSERPITIRNTGNATLNVSGLSGPSGFTATWTSGQIPAGGSQDVRLRFAPTEVRSYSGTLTVSGDHTSGLNTAPINAQGQREIFQKRGSGSTVFDMPTSAAGMRIRVYAHWNGRGNSNFIVSVGGRTAVNAILRDGNPYEALFLTGGGVVQITSSDNIDDWRFTEER
jgi:hypothetical protein